MRLISPSLSTKIAVSLDIAGTLFIEQIGSTYRLPFYHPAIVGLVFGLTYALFKWKEEIAHSVIGFTFSIQSGSREFLKSSNKILDVIMKRTSYHISNNINITSYYKDDINSRLIRMKTLQPKGYKYR